MGRLKPFRYKIPIVAIAGILTILITGWYWHASKDRATEVRAGDNPTQTTEGSEVPSNHGDQAVAFSSPSGYKEYRDEVAGFSFTYPADWGEVRVVTVDTGKKRLDFTGQEGDVERYGIRLHTADAPHTDTDNPILDLVGFTVSNEQLSIRYVLWNDGPVARDRIVSMSNGEVIFTTSTDDGAAKFIQGLKSIGPNRSEVVIFEYRQGILPADQGRVAENLKKLMDSFKEL